MDFINFHIAYLLTKHECVIIPDFGAFVVTKTKESIANKKGFISPPTNYSLIFNPEIILDDGLLINSVAIEKAISKAEALYLINNFVDGLVDTLRKGESVQFPCIGEIHLSDDREIVYTPAKNLSCNATNCGFVNLNFPELSETPKDELKEKRKKIYNLPLFYIISAVVLLLAILSVFLFFKPLNKNWFSQQNLTTVGDISKNNPSNPAIDSTLLISADSIKSKMVDSLKPIVSDSIKNLFTEYYIIVSSMTNEKEAEVMLNYIITRGLKKAKIIHSDEKYRISIEKFDNKEDAISFLDNLQKNKDNPLFKDAWIFEVSH